jgi:hypothetical protein
MFSNANPASDINSLLVSALALLVSHGCFRALSAERRLAVSTLISYLMKSCAYFETFFHTRSLKSNWPASIYLNNFSSSLCQNGICPESRIYAITPQHHRSHMLLWALLMTSGATYMAVPTNSLCISSSFVNCFEAPKSMILIYEKSLFDSNKIFSGFRSRCMMFF